MRGLLRLLNLSRSSQAAISDRQARLTVETLEDRRLMALVIGREPVRTDPVTAWIDQNIQDTALKTLVKQVEADRVLSRNDMISIFNQAASGGVNSTEFSDLQDLLSRPDLLGTPGHVQELAENVVQGDPANARYQGGSLGNLYAGSSATHLNKLTNKWFLGLDRPALPSGAGYTYQAAAGTLFASGGPSFADVDQGALGDCWFLASLEEVALRSPALIKNMFIDNGDGTLTVRFFRGSDPEYVTVDRYLPVDAGNTFAFANSSDAYNDTSNTLWPALAEKAYAQLNESGWVNSGAENNSYWALDGGFADPAMKHLTGQNAAMIAMPGGAATVLGAAIGADFLAGKMIVFCTDHEGVASNIVASHCYAMLGYDQATGTFTLGNPWGTDAQVNGLPGGILTLTTQQLFGSFRAFVIVNPSEAITTLDTILHTQEIPRVWPAVIVDWIPNIIDYEVPVLRDAITVDTLRLNVYRAAEADLAAPPQATGAIATLASCDENSAKTTTTRIHEAIFADGNLDWSFAKPAQTADTLLASSEIDFALPLATLDDLFAELGEL